MSDIQQELKKGDFFTVTKWISGSDHSFVGDCLEVIVIDQNLARVWRHFGKNSKECFTMNLNNVEIRILSKEFVDNVLVT